MLPLQTEILASRYGPVDCIESEQGRDMIGVKNEMEQEKRLSTEPSLRWLLVVVARARPAAFNMGQPPMVVEPLGMSWNLFEGRIAHVVTVD